MLGMALDGLWRDCCKRAVPLSRGGSEGPCPPDEIEVLHPIPDILEIMELEPVIAESEELTLAPAIIDTEELVPDAISDVEELVPDIIDTDTDEDC